MWYNERYVRDISRKIRANLRYKIQKGDYLGHAPFGYKKSEDVRNRLVIDEQEAEAVRTIYKAYLYGLGYSGIARLMESKGISPPKERWNPATIQRILTSRVYLGDTVQGVSERISFKSKKARRLPSARWVLTENTHEAIISREDYEEVQRLRSGKSLRAGSHKGSISLFNGVVYCGGCGSRLNARVRRGVRGYICGNYGRNGLKGCTSHYISEEDLKKLVSDEIRVLLADQELIEKVGRMLGKELLPQGTPEERSEKLKTQLTGKLRQQEVLYRDRLEGRITLELFERMNASLEDKIGFLKEEISGLQVTDSRGEVKGIMEEAVDWLRSGGLSHGIIIAMVNRITVYSKGDEGFATLLEEVPDAAAAKTLAVVEFRF